MKRIGLTGRFSSLKPLSFHIDEGLVARYELHCYNLNTRPDIRLRNRIIAGSKKSAKKQNFLERHIVSGEPISLRKPDKTYPNIVRYNFFWHCCNCNAGWTVWGSFSIWHNCPICGSTIKTRDLEAEPDKMPLLKEYCFTFNTEQLSPVPYVDFEWSCNSIKKHCEGQGITFAAIKVWRFCPICGHKIWVKIH